METLLTILVLLLLSAASGWLKKRTEGSESEEPLPPPRPMGRPAPRPPSNTPPAPGERRPVTRTWEEELRRLLEGEAPAAPPPPPPPLRPAEPMVPPRHQAPPPIIVAPSPPERPKAPPLRPQPSGATVPALAELTATARRQAERLQERAAMEVKRAEVAAARQIAQTHATHRAGRTAEITAARGMLSSPEAARQAIIVSVVLGPPVGL